jgi:putative endonuclease
MRDEYIYYVYMMQSASRRALYIGMTSNLRKRVWEHKNHIREGFTDDYNCTRLVYWESFDDVVNAINREKQLKRWRREKKMWLIERKNPRWQDLAVDWYPAATQGPSTAQDSQKPRDPAPLAMTIILAVHSSPGDPTHCHPERKRTVRRTVL